MTHGTTPLEQKAASDRCCSGMDKGKTAAPAVAKPDAKPAADPKHPEQKEAGSSCC